MVSEIKNKFIVLLTLLYSIIILPHVKGSNDFQCSDYILGCNKCS